MRSVLVVLITVVTLVAPGVATARSVRFVAAHPVAASQGGGYCHIEIPHSHPYDPDHAALYQPTTEGLLFTGDPTPFGYAGERHVFHGHHPVTTVGGEAIFCFLDGPHHHPFAVQGPDYRVKDGVAFYVGLFPPSYVRLRQQRARIVNAEYLPFAQYRPQVIVQPPPGWRGNVAPPPSVAVPLPRPQVVVQPPPPVVFIDGEGKRKHFKHEGKHGHGWKHGWRH